MLEKALKKERDHQDVLDKEDKMEDVSRDHSQHPGQGESPWRSVSQEGYTPDRTQNNYSNIKTEFHCDEDMRESIQNMAGAGKNDLKVFLKEPRASRYIQMKFATFVRTYKVAQNKDPL